MRKAMTSKVRTQLDALLATRILVLDGAMGTMVQRHQLTEADFRGQRFKDHPKDLRGNNDILVLTRPDVIAEIHRQYLEAGSDIIETNTFSGTAIAPDVNNPAFRNMTFDALRDAFKEQARGLIDGGSDLLLVETIVDTLNAKAAIVGIEELYDDRRTPNAERLPLMISVTITDRSGRTLSGQTIDAFWVSIAHARPFSVGINCALGARDMRPYLAELSGIANCYVSCYPNAGLPNAFGAYDEQAAATGGYLREFATSGFVNIVGGCCGPP